MLSYNNVLNLYKEIEERKDLFGDSRILMVGFVGKPIDLKNTTYRIYFLYLGRQKYDVVFLNNSSCIFYLDEIIHEFPESLQEFFIFHLDYFVGNKNDSEI